MMFLLLWTGCAGVPSGASEPITVREGTFHAGDLPFDDNASVPSVIYVASVGYVITAGQSNIHYGGLATPEAWSVAVAFPELGSGYWVVPMDGPDVTQDNNLLFDLTVDFARDLPFGLTALSFVAIDGEGNPGPRYDATLCILPDFADGNFAACEPELPPQHTVLSLSWDTQVDLDLVVVTPDGVVVDAASPSTESPEEEEDPDEEVNIGVLSRDSNNGCVLDGVRLESLIFEEAPPEGPYAVYARLFSACGEPSVVFELDLHQRVDNADGSWSIESTPLGQGGLLGSQAHGSDTFGTYVTTVTL